MGNGQELILIFSMKRSILLSYHMKNVMIMRLFLSDNFLYHCRMG